MRQFNRFRGTKGFITMWERVIRFRYMITEEAKKRCKILAFWDKHGTSATIEAFNIKRRTLFLWQEKLRKGSGKLESLNPIKKTPKNKRKRIWDSRILEEIKILRTDHHNLGKENLQPLLYVPANQFFQYSTEYVLPFLQKAKVPINATRQK